MPPFFSEDGFWAGGAFKFTMTMPKSYPHDAPKVHCDTKVRAPTTRACTSGPSMCAPTHVRRRDALTVSARAGVPSKH